MNEAEEQLESLRSEVMSWRSVVSTELELGLSFATPPKLIEHLSSLKIAAAEARKMVMRNSVLTVNLEQAARTIEHLRRVETAYAQASNDLHSARRGVQAFMNELQQMLFEVAGNTGPSEAATTLVLADQPVRESLNALVSLSEAMHGSRPFQYAMPILAPTRRFPLAWRSDLGPLRVVDVGSEELASESDMYAPLWAVAPVEVIGFDPFVPPAASDNTVAPKTVDVTRTDGSRIRTFPNLLADGGNVTFHVNRYRPTSSILPSNHELTRPFGLLDVCIETDETCTFQSYRVDDVLPLEGDAARIDLLKIDVQGAAHILLENAAGILRNTLICHVEIEFAPIYLGEKLFGDVDLLLRAAGFCFVDFFSLGRQRYARFETSSVRAFHRGRTLWADCIYIKNLDTEGALSADDLFRAACIVHSCYNKEDLAAELLGRLDSIAGTRYLENYVNGTDASGANA